MLFFPKLSLWITVMVALAEWGRAMLCCSRILVNIGTQIYHIFSNLIRTSFCRFLKWKKLEYSSNPHLWEDDGEDTDDSDWVTDNDSVMSVDGKSDE